MLKSQAAPPPPTMRSLVSQCTQNTSTELNQHRCCYVVTHLKRPSVFRNPLWQGEQRASQSTVPLHKSSLKGPNVSSAIQPWAFLKKFKLGSQWRHAQISCLQCCSCLKKLLTAFHPRAGTSMGMSSWVAESAQLFLQNAHVTQWVPEVICS